MDDRSDCHCPGGGTPRNRMTEKDMQMTPKTEIAEVRLSVRDLFSLAGAALTLVCALWAFSSDIKTTLVTLSARLGVLEQRVERIEAANVPEKGDLYRRFMEQMRRVQPSPQDSPSP